MKKPNIWRIVWKVGMYLTLILILYLVVIYKVKWEYRDTNKYMYFYNCSSEICTTDNKVEEYYSRVVCNNNICPYVKEKKGNYVILSDSDKEYIFDYKENKIINDLYKNYTFVDEDKAIVINHDDLYGVINIDGSIIVDFTELQIVNYKAEYVAYVKDGRYGIFKNNDDYKIDAKYDQILLLNDKLFSYYTDNTYYIASYETKEPVNNVLYDYIYVFKDVMLIINNSQLDIIDMNINSKLGSRVMTYYPYTKDSERNTLKIKEDDNLLHFSIYKGEHEYINYTYDIKNNLLYN